MKRILIVDDSQIMRESLKEALVHVGIDEILAFENGEQLIIAYKELYENNENVDLVITDGTMPVMGGIDVLTNILKINQNAVVIIYGGLPFNCIPEAFHNRAKGFIGKPIDPKQLHQLLSKYL